MEHLGSIERNKAVEDKHLNPAVFSEPAILIELGPYYQPSMDAKSMYAATRSLLAVNGGRAGKTKLVCVAYRGFIKEVYVVSRWTRPHFWSSYGFVGEIAAKELREKYVGRSVAAYWDWASRAPMKFASYRMNGKDHKN